MKISYKCNPLERDEYGHIHDFEKTWVCFTITVKKAEDERAAVGALEFIEWHLYYKADIRCALLRCVQENNGVFSDILTFDRDKSMRKAMQVRAIQNALREAKAALYADTAAAIPPHILAATRKTA